MISPRVQGTYLECGKIDKWRKKSKIQIQGYLFDNSAYLSYIKQLIWVFALIDT